MSRKRRTRNAERRTGSAAHVRRFTFCVLHFAFCVGLTGCTLIGAVAGKVAPEPMVPAAFAPAPEPTVVLVENYHNPASLRLESEAVARHLTEELEVRQVVPVVAQSEVTSFRQSQGAAYRKMPLDAIGMAVGARQVIYVDLERFDLTRAIGSEMYGGRAEARVRVVDDAGEVLWPIDSAGGHPVAVKLEPRRVSSGLGDHAVRQQLHAALADKVAKLFYAWRPDSSEAADREF